jgi:hypothetical protein|tara:strand:- start:101 stop:1150 length:1050 start_codon:yes stop_codon:yes gene_type:complete
MKSKFIVIIVFLGFILINCESSPGGSGNQSDLEDALLYLISMDGKISLDGFGDETTEIENYIDDDDGSYLGRGSMDVIWTLPVRWGRYDINVEGSVVFEEYALDADTIYAEISKFITGILVVINGDTATTDTGFAFSPTDTTEKPFEMESLRRIRFVRNNDSGNMLEDWKINGLTPAVCTSPGSTVDITSISIERLVSFNENGLGIFEPYFSLDFGNDILNMFFTNSEWPHFLHHEFLKIKVDVDNTNPNMTSYQDSGEGVFIHYGRKFDHKGRRRLFDDGSQVSFHGYFSNDGMENDNEFTRLWKVHQTLDNHHYRSFFDVIDYETFLNPDGEYHSKMVLFPYWVIND